MSDPNMPLVFDPQLAAQPARDFQTRLSSALGAAVSTANPGDKLVVEVATGGGKRRILSDFLAAYALGDCERTLVLSKDWPLVEQLASDFVGRHQGALQQISFVGDGEAKTLFADAVEGVAGRVVYTTTQTWFARRHTTFATTEFNVIAIDESHWGERGTLFRALFDRYRQTAIFVGLTATPRAGSDFRRVGDAYPLKTLVEGGFLARPMPIVIETGIDWAPRRSIAHGDFLPSSLEQLGSDGHRNETILQTYLNNRDNYGQTLIFACGIVHAQLLAESLAAEGVAATWVHCQLPKEEVHARVQAFAESRIQVLTNFAMLTHGVDIPSINSVFAARPTTSDILFSQMIGRGARKTSSKQEFFVVDFQDNIQTHGVDVVRADGFLGTRVGGQRERGPRLAAHAFERGDLVVLESEPGYELLAGLEVQPHQTFGIELEAVRGRVEADSAFLPTAVAIGNNLRLTVPMAPAPLPHSHMPGKDNTVWNVEPDPSCGFEVTSRILVGVEGFREVVDACRALDDSFERLGLTSNSTRAGMHVHLAATLDRDALSNLLAISSFYEPAIMSLVAPSRAKTPFVRTARRTLKALLAASSDDVRTFAGRGWKYSGVNPTPLATSYGTVEIRYHSATIDPQKILPWISLWMRIFDAAVRGGIPGDPLKRVRSRPLCAGPRGDVAELCKFVGAGPALTERLVRRRNQIVAKSWCAHTLFGARARKLREGWLQSDGARGGAAE